MVEYYSLDAILAIGYRVRLRRYRRDGGEIVALGAPEEVARAPRSFTGEFLRRVL